MDDSKIRLFCFDYDETLATEGHVRASTLEALERLKRTDRKLVLVTGRVVSDLLTVFSQIGICDLVVAENGGTLYNPTTRQEKMLTASPPPSFIAALQEEKIPIKVGRAIVASHVPFEKPILQVIHQLGIEYQIIFNKGSLMMLPSGVNKASGLTAALAELQVPARSVAGIGDGENDHAFLALCGMSVAVSNAVPSLKEEVDWVASGPAGTGVEELIAQILSKDAVVG